MLPAYAAALALALALAPALASLGRPVRWHLPLRLLTAGLIVAAVGAGSLHPVFSLPQPTGPDPVGTTLLKLPPAPAKAAGDELASSPPTLQVWYPAAAANRRETAPYALGATATGVEAYLGTQRLVRTAARLDAGFLPGGGRRPIVLFVASWGGKRWENTAEAQELASHGYVVVAMGDRYPEPPLDLSSERAFRTTLAWADEKVRRSAMDALAVLDFLSELDRSDPRGRFTHRLDLSRVGIFGFSFGGAVALEAASMTSQFRAVADLDGWLFGAAADRWIDRLVLIMSEGPAAGGSPVADMHASSIAAERNAAALDDRSERQMDAGFARSGGYLLTIAGTNHFNFSDRAFASPIRRWVGAGPIAPRRATRIINDYLLAFFGKTLSGQPAPLLEPGAPRDPAAALSIHAPPRAIDRRLPD